MVFHNPVSTYVGYSRIGREAEGFGSTMTFFEKMMGRT